MNFKKVIVDVRVRDLDRAVGFYGEVLELTLITRADDWASFDARGMEIHLVTFTGVMEGVEFLVEDIEAEMKNLENKGVKFFTEKFPDLQRTEGNIMHFAWGKLALFKDSEGSSLALVEK